MDYLNMEKIKTIEKKELYCDLCKMLVGHKEEEAGYELCRTKFGDFCSSCRDMKVVGVIELTKEQMKKLGGDIKK